MTGIAIMSRKNNWEVSDSQSDKSEEKFKETEKEEEDAASDTELTL